ncbi:IclR family transcriptional regulator [Saccharopolyspora erythraea NRRL 2338]|uniref:Transcriptional regulator, IclR family n=2 Tax=Saccharopolyspora erythraea TaxID=1836 RepID=A4FDD2_SACEN|nr:IclR family transcriptional regulator [Saccharopolyspora erythraea]EQD84830.1 IclR family transcriptional regulator [Saccharopolyspora erythraea D]PFG95798.1 IclR family transcriptional regulator [Saccharopolyspora erythraea NRRL 2338]QRK92384.1 IclR family transcriptional regulator [Saccharopolyspora erythraea]CAM02057.1 transcriptional regulator, IclR family [Saccharopolyspora erythraea NRRL 2338]
MGDEAEHAAMANKSVSKAVRLLRELAAQPRTGATVTTLAKATGLSRPTAFRLLYSLEQAGLVDRIDTNYVLGWELARLGRRADPYTGLVAHAQPVLQELADEFNESVTLSVPNSHDGLDLVAEAAGSHVVGIVSRNMVGEQYPMHASSTGKVLLAEQPPDKLRAMLPEKLEAFTPYTITDRTALIKELEQVREQGFAIIDNELENELLSLSRPIRDSAGTLVAILTLNSPRSRFGRARIPEALQQMQRTADRLTALFWRDATSG